MISFKVKISQMDIFWEWKIPQNSISNLLWPFCLQLLPIGNLAVVAFYLETCSQETLISKWSPALGILCFCVQCIFSQQKGPFWPCMCDWDILFKQKNNYCHTCIVPEWHLLFKIKKMVITSPLSWVYRGKVKSSPWLSMKRNGGDLLRVVCR